MVEGIPDHRPLVFDVIDRQVAGRVLLRKTRDAKVGLADRRGHMLHNLDYHVHCDWGAMPFSRTKREAEQRQRVFNQRFVGQITKEVIIAVRCFDDGYLTLLTRDRQCTDDTSETPCRREDAQ